MGNFININGKIVAEEVAAIPHDSRAFRYGYGLFETMLVQKGSIALADYHFERLFKGMKQLCFSVPALWDEAFFIKEISKTVSRNRLENLVRVRLQVWNGNGGLYDAETGQPQFIIECFPLAESVVEWNENGLTVGIASDYQKSKDALSNLKSSNALIYAAAAQVAKTKKWNDALIQNSNGHIIESTIANIFWVKDKITFTPPLTEGCIDGVMRRHLLWRLEVNGQSVIETILTKDILQHADEVFLTNSIRNIKWIKEIGGKSYGNVVSFGLHNLLTSKG